MIGNLYHLGILNLGNSGGKAFHHAVPLQLKLKMLYYNE